MAQAKALAGRLTPIDTVLIAGGAAITLVVAYASIRAALGVPDIPVWAQRTVRETAVIIHLATIIPAMPLGLYLLARRKGDPVHRTLGKLWMALMGVTALASFFISHMTGGFSPIHILSIATLLTIPRAIAAARRHDVKAHRRGVMILYAMAVVVAGFFTFVPGRVMHVWAFG